MSDGWLAVIFILSGFLICAVAAEVEMAHEPSGPLLLDEGQSNPAMGKQTVVKR